MIFQLTIGKGNKNTFSEAFLTVESQPPPKLDRAKAPSNVPDLFQNSPDKASGKKDAGKEKYAKAAGNLAAYINQPIFRKELRGKFGEETKYVMVVPFNQNTFAAVPCDANGLPIIKVLSVVGLLPNDGRPGPKKNCLVFTLNEKRNGIDPATGLDFVSNPKGTLFKLGPS